MNTQVTQKVENSTQESVLYMAMELSNKKWRLAFSNGDKKRRVVIEARRGEQLGEAIAQARQKFGLSASSRVLSCFEAGRDGFWLHYYLTSLGIENVVVDSSSIEVNRRKKRAKTDRIDGDKLLGMLRRYHGGEKKLWSVLRIPSVEVEDIRQLDRELGRLKKERTRHTNSIRSLLCRQGIVVKKVGGKDWETAVEGFQQWNGQPLTPQVRADLKREGGRLELVRRQIREVIARQKELIESGEGCMIGQVARLMKLRSIGFTGGWTLVTEFFGWRCFNNRRQVAAASGLTGTPYGSGDSQRDQGISKAGNRRVRPLSIELSWCWLRYQPESELSRWYNERFAGGGKRMRKIGIVALARRLLIALWRYLEDGVIPKGAKMKEA